MDKNKKEMLSRLAKGIAAEFGMSCEVALHEIHRESNTSSIVAIENGHVSNRMIGDGPSQAVLTAMKKNKNLEDQLNYRTATEDGRILRSSTIYIKDDLGEIEGVLSINYDITQLIMMESSVKALINEKEKEEKPNKITNNGKDL